MNQAKKSYIIALDQGTTSSRAIIFNRNVEVVAMAQKEFTQIYPQSGWVEHDPMEIWSSQRSVLTEVLARSGIESDEIAAIGITNQRETTVVWDKKTGRPIHNAIVWQCRRTAGKCDELKKNGLEEHIKETTGLVTDAYFSGTKVAWILDNVEGARERAAKGELLFGTIDTWLVWQLTRGKAHVTDYTNASRTMLYDINKLQWDPTILKALNIPEIMLPDVKASSEIYGETTLGTSKVPIAGMAGDQQSALFGQLCISEGLAKNTYGTGCFLLMHTGSKLTRSKNGLLTTIAIGPKCEVNYALEGSVFMGGAVIQWLRDELGLIRGAEDSEYFAKKVDDSNGVYLVPAFVGLGAPHWDPYARGTLVGLTRGANRNHIIRASLESIGYQVADLLTAMEQDSGLPIAQIKVDGGASANNFLLQFQADLTDTSVVRPKLIETTAMGAAFLAGLATGFWDGTDELKSLFSVDREFNSQISDEERIQKRSGWDRAVSRSLHWAEK
jgi:glycerol kinase